MGENRTSANPEDVTSVTFRVRRYDPDAGDAPRFQEYALDVPPGMTVLEALLALQSEQDGSLSFRYACRGAVCGSCAMQINGAVGLACRVQVLSLQAHTVTLEPLAGMTVLKDLVVDMDPFFAKNRAVSPWLQTDDPEPEGERLVEPEELEEAAPYTHCILCASCWTVCPAAERDGAYLGPAALAKQYRFIADARDHAREERLASVNGDAGVWGCDMVFNCVKACPKDVPPTKAIGRMRASIRRAEKKGSP